MSSIAPEEQRIGQIKVHLNQLSNVAAENIIVVIRSFLTFLQEPKNVEFLNNRNLYPYFSALIKKHSAILKALGLIDTECVFQGGITPLKQLEGMYGLVLFTQTGKNLTIENLKHLARLGNLQTAMVLAKQYREKLSESKENLGSLVNEIDESVFSNPSALQAKGFFLSAQLYYQISQQYLQTEKSNPDKLKSSNAFKYFEKAILHYLTARHLLRAEYGQESMPLVVDEGSYPNANDEDAFKQYVTHKVDLFKDNNGVVLNSSAVARTARLKAEFCAQEYKVKKEFAAKAIPENLESILHKIVCDIKPVSATSYSGAYFSLARGDARAISSNPAVSGPKP